MARFLDKNWSRQDLLHYVGNLDQLAAIHAFEAIDGIARGSRLLRGYTGSGLCFDVLPDRALDLGAFSYRGVPLAWLSPAGTAHPAYYDDQDFGWLRSFQGGMMTTCGLDHFGVPTTDGDQRFGLHGRISSTPSNQVSYRTYWNGDEYELEISGQVRQARIFGETLILDRRISTRLGARQIRVEDVVTNAGNAPQPHMILYHCNLGFPLISEQTTLIFDSAETVARNAHSEQGLADWQHMQKPTAGYQEQVFRHRPTADEHGIVHIQVTNKALNFGLSIRYNSTTLPYLFQWKMPGQRDYVLGIEPANTGTLEGRVHAREMGILPLLEPGESCNYMIEFEVTP